MSHKAAELPAGFHNAAEMTEEGAGEGYFAIQAVIVQMCGKGLAFAKQIALSLWFS